jgi:hypothetical protein
VKLRGLLSTVFAIAFGILVLLGYFFEVQPFYGLRVVFVEWAVILAGFAILVGLGNLLSVHIKRLRAGGKGSGYGLLLIFSLLMTFLAGLAWGPDHPNMALLFRTVQFPVEASLMALLTVSLAYASIRMLRRRLNLFSVVFLGTVLVILLGTATLPLLGDVPFLGDWVRPFVSQVIAGAGARGILIGVALGTLTTGLRVLFGADRPYGGR